MRLCIAGLLGQSLLAITHTVRLDVGLVDDVQSILITQVIPLGRVGIVARTNGVDVKLLHQFDILNHSLARHHKALQRIHLVTIHTLDQHGLTIHQQQSILNLRCAETHSLRIRLAIDAYHHLIQIRCLGRPLRRGLHLEGVRRLTLRGCNLRLGYHLTLGANELHLGLLNCR